MTAAPPRGHSQNYLQSPALEHQGGTGAASVHVSSFSTQQLHHFPFQVSFPLSAPDSLVKTEESNLVNLLLVPTRKALSVHCDSSRQKEDKGKPNILVSFVSNIAVLRLM